MSQTPSEPSSSPPLPLVSAGVPADAGQPKPGALRGFNSDFWALVGCNLIVFASSVCIMVLELTASRLIAGHLGQSLYSWTSVIGVVLAGLSFGNFLGGWLADRYAPHRILPWLFLISGLLTFSVLFVNQWTAKLDPWTFVSWQTWVIGIVAAIFLPPSVALGTISPVTASMALRRTQHTGMTVGNIYAWGAMGSIAGTFLAGFFLIDVFGSRAIIVVTAGALLALGAIVAAGQWALRSAILSGGLPFLAAVTLCVAATSDSTGRVTGAIGAVVDPPKPVAKASKRLPAAKEEETPTPWKLWGMELGKNLQELGLTLKLRNDPLNEYRDESNYSEIGVAPYYDNDRHAWFKVLVLDALQHSYWDADDPTRLNYDYEQVYAGITERSANSWQRTSSITLREVPQDAFNEKLPEGVNYDQATKKLQITGAMSDHQLRDLAGLGSLGTFRTAVLAAWTLSHVRQGESLGTPLQELPEGVEFPLSIAEKVRYDPFVREIVCDKPLSLEEAMGLILLANEQKAYMEDVFQLYRESRHTSTLFIGGGGFVFPRWIEAKFPNKPLIDVAEIDPAVVLAVQIAMGLPADPKLTAVRSHVADARKFIDDVLHKNARVAPAEAVHYDFVYGDAFNHYSVPWHLTTEEFSQKVKALLSPREGVYLVNIIDIFPRTEFPPASQEIGSGTVTCAGRIPVSLEPTNFVVGAWCPAAKPFEKLQIRWSDGDKYELWYNEAMTPETRKGLADLARLNGREILDLAVYRDAVHQLYTATHERFAYLHPLPAALPVTTVRDDWTLAAAPFLDVEVLERGPGRLILGYRGMMSDEAQAKLKQLAPHDAPFAEAVDKLAEGSRSQRVGQFLGRYVNTVRRVFPNVYVFTSNEGRPSNDRDTFVVACSMRPLNFENLVQAGGHWPTAPFAWSETTDAGPMKDGGQMPAILSFARGQILTDDFAPVDNLLAPLFEGE